MVEPLAPGRYRVQFTASAELRAKLERLRGLMRSSVPDGDLAAVIEEAVTEKLQRLEARRFGRTKAGRQGVLAQTTLPAREEPSPAPGDTFPSASQDSGATGSDAGEPVAASAADRPQAAHGPQAADGQTADGREAADGSEAADGAQAAGGSPAAWTRSSVTRHVPAAVRRAVYERDGGRCAYADAKGRRCTARVGLEYHHRHPFGLGGDHSVRAVGLLCRSHNLFLAEIDYGREAVARHRRARKPAFQPSVTEST